MDSKEYLSDPRTVYHAKEHLRLKEELDSLETMNDAEMGDLVLEEREKLKEQILSVEKTIKDIISGDEEKEKFPNEIILEVRAGAGGDEASIFARDLSDMYERYALKHGFSFSPVGISRNNVDGYKEASFQVKGSDVYKLLRFETGVHRIQRIPTTEKSGRIHTSTASVAILPIRKKKKFNLDENDLKIEFSRSGGAGGQNVNKVESAVRIVHIPTGLDVRCTEERTQLKNRERAMAILSAKVEQKEREEEDLKYANMRREQIGTSSRSEKIRTYNVLQDRVTDHRIKQSWSNIENILGGDIEIILDTLNNTYEKGF